MKISVKVPATTANLGPGFDCLGMALPIYNTITIEETVLPGTGIEINAINDASTSDDLSIFQWMKQVSYTKQLNYCITQLGKLLVN